MTAATTIAERTGRGIGHHPQIVKRRPMPEELFTAEHAYAVRLVQFTTAASERALPIELGAGNRTAAERWCSEEWPLGGSADTIEACHSSSTRRAVIASRRRAIVSAIGRNTRQD